MDTMLYVLLASMCHQLGMLDLSFGVAKEARVNIMTEDGEGEKWDRRIMVLSSQHQALFFWPGTRKYPKGPVARVWRLHVLVLWFGRGLTIKLGVCVCVCGDTRASSVGHEIHHLSAPVYEVPGGRLCVAPGGNAGAALVHSCDDAERS